MQVRVQERKDQDSSTFTRAAGWRLKSASAPTVSSTSRGQRTYCGARPPQQNARAREREWRRGMPRARDGSKSSSLGLLLGLPSEGLLRPHRKPQLWNSLFHLLVLFPFDWFSSNCAWCIESTTVWRNIYIYHISIICLLLCCTWPHPRRKFILGPMYQVPSPGGSPTYVKHSTNRE